LITGHSCGCLGNGYGHLTVVNFERRDISCKAKKKMKFDNRNLENRDGVITVLVIYCVTPLI